MRLFVAIDINNPPLLNALAHLPTTLGRPAALSNLHLTLFFIGEVSASHSLAIAERLSALHFLSFEIQLQGVGAFPNFFSPRVVWVGLDNESEAVLTNLVAQITDLLQPLRLPQRGIFRPHVTLFRINKGRGGLQSILAPYQQRQWGQQKVQKITLKKSVLTPQGARYSNLVTITSQL